MHAVGGFLKKRILSCYLLCGRSVEARTVGKINLEGEPAADGLNPPPRCDMRARARGLLSVELPICAPFR